MLRVSIITVAVFLLTGGVALGADDSPFNVDFFCGWGDCYRPMEWTPVEIGVSSTLENPFGCAVEISAPQDGLNTLNIRHSFVLTPDLPANLPLVTKFAFTADRCDIRLIEEVRGKLRRTVYQEKREFWGGAPGERRLTAITRNDMLIGHLGARRFGLLNLAKQAFSQTRRGQGKVYTGYKINDMVPWDWTGFVSLDCLVLYDPEWDQLKREPLEAISQWVSNGGRLLLVLGTNPMAADNPIRKLLPVEPGQLRETTVDSALLGKFDLDSGQSEKVACWPLTAKSGARLCVEDRCDSGDCLFAAANVGFGRVGVMAFDPSALSDKHRARSGRFWVGRIKAVTEDNHKPDYRSGGRGGIEDFSRTIRFSQAAEDSEKNQHNMGHYEIGLAHSANNAVMNYLYKGIKPLSISWVIMILVTLAILLGPADYIVLKRLGRLPLTWITCTFWIVVFTIFSYYGVQYLRAGDLEMRVVTILDGIEDESNVWSTDYCGIFAPRSAEYRLKDLGEKQWWSGIAPTEQNVWSYRREAGSRKIYCEQEDGRNEPNSLPINIWTIQCLMSEEVVEKGPLSAQVSRDGTNISLTVSNESDAKIIDGYVLFDGGQGMRMGKAVGPRSSEQFSGKLRRLDGWRGTDLNRLERAYRSYGSPDGAGTLRREDAYFAQGVLQRTRAIDTYLAHGAAVVCVEYDNPETSFKVDARGCAYDHIQLARLVVFPKEDSEDTGL